MEQLSSPTGVPPPASRKRRKSSRFRKLSLLSVPSLISDEKSENDTTPSFFQSLLDMCPCIPKQKTYEDGRILMIGGGDITTGHYCKNLTDINMDKTQTTFGANKKSNKFRTAKYTKLTFFPLNLYEQFRRIANIYFLLSLVMAFIFAKYTPISPFSWMTNLVFLVAVTMAKQGYEDYLRHQSDK